MEFNKAYNRQEFANFLYNSFLPNDFIPESTPVSFRTKMKYSTQAVKLGASALLDLVVYEVRHKSKHDARVSLSKEAFRMLADEMEDRALVVFVPEDNNDNYRFSLIEITLEAKEDSARITRNYSNPRRYSYFLGKGIAYYTPNKYLNEKGRVVSPEDLRSRFSVEVLTKEFYQELSDWYAWAIKIIRFPNDLNDKTDDDKYNNESAIRLITRLIFVWFLKQRHLIPDEFFDEKYIADNLIKDFNPHVKVDLFYKSNESRYYKAILQNLFFAMLNSPITPEGSTDLSERHFRNGRGDYDNNKLMRYESYFKNPQLFVDLANKTVPFLNGGLFDCLDEKDKDIYYDGFSDREAVKKSLVVPDYLFFGEEVGKNIDLSEWYGDKKKKKVSARGIIDILKRYNFTVEENTPFDQEVSLDPELLGKVFENLLASYNPETQTTARKQTGSFYTPREIVQYMVDESLVAHLKRTVGEELEPQFRQLMQYTDDEVDLTDEQRKQIMLSLYNCKVLDPACGSGAFPMGMLQQMVHILSRIDPDNTQWKDMMLNKAINETSEAYRTASSDERREIITDIERSFDESVNRPDYARKLYLIENCIYGVDIQPIAIQISKLRFFISLVVDQKSNNNPVENFGIRPLPNLEAKFVAANTLIGLNKNDATLFDTDAIRAKKEELKIAKHKIFGAKTVRTKRKYRQIVNNLRLEIADMLEDCGAVGNAEAQQLASWDMFDQNTYSNFFDPEWMFDVKDGFDIVIGNPPYIDSETMKRNMPHMREIYKSLYSSASGNWDIYIVFYELGMRLSRGSLIYITPNKWLSIAYGKVLRNIVFEYISSICDCRNIKVFDAGNEPIITLISKSPSATIKTLRFNTSYIVRHLHDIPKTLISKDTLGAIISEHIKLLMKIKSAGKCINSYASVENPFSTSEAYQLIPLICDSYENKKVYKLINTGTIDPYLSLWGKVETRYLKFKYKHPIIDKSLFAKKFPKRVRQASAIKIVVSGMRNFEAYFDENGEYIAGKSTIIIIGLNVQQNKIMLAILNSKLISFYIRESYSTLGIGGGINFSQEMVSNLPISDIFSINNKLVEYVDSLLLLITSSNNNNDEYVNILKKKIELIVSHFYGLTYDEVLIVDPQTLITREEYERTNME